MEFKFRAIDNKPAASTTTTSFPLSSERSLSGGGGFSGGMENNTFRIPVSAGEAFRREIEKEQIRREIIASEMILQRRELEEEVRNEMVRERVFGMSMQRCLGLGLNLSAPSFLEQRPLPLPPLPLTLSPPLTNIPNLTNHVAAIGGVSYSQPQIQEIKPSQNSDKDRIIILPKPDPDVYNAKRKAVTLTPTVDDTESETCSAFGLKKKMKKEWKCALCNISATSESGLNDHMLGRKHKAKEAATRLPRIIGLDAKADRWQFPQPVMESKTEEELLLKSHTIGGGGLENQNEKETKEAGKTNAFNLTQLQFPQIKAPMEITPDRDSVAMLAKPDPENALTPTATNETEASSAFGLKENPKKEWKCEVCKVSATNESGLTNHLHGRKHKAKEAALGTQNIGNSSEASLLSKESDQKDVKATETMLTTTSVLVAKADKQMPQPCMSLEELNQTMSYDSNNNKGVVNEEQVVKKSETTCGFENQDGRKTEEAVKTSALRRRKRRVTLRCEVCQIRTYSQDVMENHKRGKKHQRQMERFFHNNAAKVCHPHPLSSHNKLQG